MPGLKRTTEPTEEPILLGQVKTYARIDASDDDKFLSEVIIPAARRWCEEYTERAFITQTWTKTLEKFETSTQLIELERPELISVTSLNYVDTDGTSQSLTENTDFITSTNGFRGRIKPEVNTVWPTVRSEELEGVTIVYTAGYGATGASVPEDIKMAMGLLINHWYENRESVLIGVASSEIEFSTKAILGPYCAREV